MNVILPDAVRINGEAEWSGMFYFGLDSNGLIEVTNYGMLCNILEYTLQFSP